MDRFIIKKRLWKINKLHLRSHFVTSVTPALEYSPGEIPKDEEHPAEETCLLLLHLHFCWEDLDSIVTWVLRDF